MEEILIFTLRYILWEILFSIVLYNIGRFGLLLITFGRYPRQKHTDKDITKIAIAGIFFIFIAWSIVALYNNDAF